jgi:D-lactate dehydrogenase
LGTVNAPQLTTDLDTRAALWHIRKGLYATVAGARRSGTTALLEDIAVPVSELAQTCISLQGLFRTHGYEDAVIFGHAKDGNIHFLINEDFSDPINTERYQAFTEDMVALVLSSGGSLKAEHGTGRMMAAFVERQYGSELYSIMLETKKAFDPRNILNPGVLISEDALAHIHNIKFNPTIQPIADTCVECGYCEPICPSKDLTTTPRQRIVIQRALADAKLNRNRELYKELSDQSVYDVEETCAVDGLCETSCPVGINTGSLVSELRYDRNSDTYEMIWNQAAEHWGTVTKAVGSLLKIIRYLPHEVITPLNKFLRDLAGSEKVPMWFKDLPSGGKARVDRIEPGADVVLFSSCLETIFESDTSKAIRSLINKAGLTFTTPAGHASLCCGTPWKSKGLVEGYESATLATYTSLLAASDNGRIPIISDNSSCSEGLIKAIASTPGSPLVVIDSVNFAADTLITKLVIKKKLGSVVLHPTCSSTALGANSNLEKIAHAISENVTIPIDWSCCAFAGDRGLLHPELTASATKVEAAEIANQKYDAYLSTNRTCEIGMSRATGNNYQHILCSLDQLSRPSKL